MTRKRRKQDSQQDMTGTQADLDRIWRDWDAYDAAKAERLRKVQRGEWQD